MSKAEYSLDISAEVWPLSSGRTKLFLDNPVSWLVRQAGRADARTANPVAGRYPRPRAEAARLITGSIVGRKAAAPP